MDELKFEWDENKTRLTRKSITSLLKKQKRYFMILKHL